MKVWAMNKNVALALTVFTVCLDAFSANVEWDRMKSVDAEVWDTGPLWMVWGYSETIPTINPVLMVTMGFNELVASQYMGGTCTVWFRKMNLGDVVNHETMNSQGLEYFYHGTEGLSGAESDYSIILQDDKPVYLGFSTEVGLWRGETHESYFVYGWVGIKDGGAGPLVVGSAWDADGGAMIVGAAAIPEPSSSVLLLLGCAGLLLGRRREFGGAPARRAGGILV